VGGKKILKKEKHRKSWNAATQSNAVSRILFTKGKETDGKEITMSLGKKGIKKGERRKILKRACRAVLVWGSIWESRNAKTRPLFPKDLRENEGNGTRTSREGGASYEGPKRKEV